MSAVKPATEVHSFLKALYQGHIEESLIFPYPEVSADTKEIDRAIESQVGSEELRLALGHEPVELLDRSCPTPPRSGSGAPSR